MELRYLRAFVAVADARHFGRAAKLLGLAQPALSRRIQRLEREVGGALFVRAPHGACLTRAGKALVQDAKRLLAAADAAVHRARMTARQPTERVHIACVDGVSPGLVSSVLQEFRRQFPTVEIGYSDLSTPAQWEAIAAGTIEIGFARYHPSVKRHVQSEPFITDPLDHVLLPAAHGLAGRDAIALREISGDPMIPHPEACYPVAHGVLMGAFAAVGFEPQLAPDRSTFWINATARVAAGEGWMLFPRSLTTLAPQNTRSVRLTDFLVPFGLELIWRRR